MVEFSSIFSALAAQPLLAQIGMVSEAEGSMPWLTLTTFAPLVGILLLLFIPKEQINVLRNVALIASLGTFALSVGIMVNFNPAVAAAAGDAFTFQMVEHIDWIPEVGISYAMGVDGISLWLVMLTTFLMPIAIWSTYGAIKENVKEYMVFLLLLEVGLVGAMLAIDLFLFFIFWEVVLVPMYFIIVIWGGAERLKAGLTFFIYTMTGSLLMLTAMVYVYFQVGADTGVYSFLYADMLGAELTYEQQFWLFAAFALSFAIKVPLFPFHTWLPLAHVQAPTAGSVLLAAVMLKLGTYGMVRLAFPLFPDAFVVYAPFIAVLAVIGIVYGAVLALIQTDVKKLVAYSSVSHLGFCVLGLVAMTPQGLAGGIYVMLAHGIATGGLFLCVGMLYERRHSKRIADFGGVAKVMPVFAVMFAVIMLGSAGLPGLNGFVGEFLSLMGAAKSHFLSFGEYNFFLADAESAFALGTTTTVPTEAGTSSGPELTAFIMAAIGALGVILGAAYLIWMFRRVMFGEVRYEEVRMMPRLTAREIGVLVPIVVMTIFMGVYPKFFMSRMDPSIHQFLSYMDVKVTEAVEAAAADEDRRNVYGQVVVEPPNEEWVPQGSMVDLARERRQQR